MSSEVQDIAWYVQQVRRFGDTSEGRFPAYGWVFREECFEGEPLAKVPEQRGDRYQCAWNQPRGRLDARIAKDGSPAG